MLRFSRTAYEEMYRSMGRVLTKEMNVLEIATGTGLISINVSQYVNSALATDFSPKMIDISKKKSVPDNVRFSVGDGANLSFPDHTCNACGEMFCVHSGECPSCKSAA